MVAVLEVRHPLYSSSNTLPLDLNLERLLQKLQMALNLKVWNYFWTSVASLLWVLHCFFKISYFLSSETLYFHSSPTYNDWIPFVHPLSWFPLWCGKSVLQLLPSSRAAFLSGGDMHFYLGAFHFHCDKHPAFLPARFLIPSLMIIAFPLRPRWKS